jgi:hypothetical protein
VHPDRLAANVLTLPHDHVPTVAGARADWSVTVCYDCTAHFVIRFANATEPVALVVSAIDPLA